MSQTTPPDTTPADEEEMAHSRSCPGCVLCREPDTPQPPTGAIVQPDKELEQILEDLCLTAIDPTTTTETRDIFELIGEAKTQILAHETQAVREALDRIEAELPKPKATAAPRGKMMPFNTSCINTGYNGALEEVKQLIEKYRRTE